jgi:hypothetical protein
MPMPRPAARRNAAQLWTVLVLLARAAFFSLAALAALPGPARAQSPVVAVLTEEESEARDMGLEMAFACSPRRHNQAGASESVIERERGALLGTAVFFRSVQGTFVVLEEYDESLAGHCLVLGWFGGALAPGRYPVSRLLQRTVDLEQATDRHSFFAMSLVRRADENGVFIPASGALELAAVEAGTMRGTFELTGVLVEDSTRRDGVTWTGSFRAVKGEP